MPCLTRLTKLGYNGTEVTHRTYNRFGDCVEIFNEITQDVGIEVVSYVLKMDFDEVATNAALLDHFTHLAGFIHAIGGSYVIMEQGLLARWNANPEEQLNHFERFVTDFAGICTDADVELIYHPTPDSFIRTPEMMDRVVELAYPLGCRICFDICDFMQMGVHPLQFLKKYLDAVRIIHFNDMKILKGKKAWMINLPEKTLIGQGKVDLKSIWIYLQAMEYKGWIVVDCPLSTTMRKGIDATTHFLTKEMEVFLTNTPEE